MTAESTELHVEGSDRVFGKLGMETRLVCRSSKNAAVTWSRSHVSILTSGGAYLLQDNGQVLVIKSLKVASLFVRLFFLCLFVFFVFLIINNFFFHLFLVFLFVTLFFFLLEFISHYKYYFLSTH